MALRLHKISGEEVLVPLSDVAKFSAGEEPSIRSLKRFLEASLSVPRFRLRLLLAGTDLEDDMSLSALEQSSELQLVVLSFITASPPDFAPLAFAAREDNASQMEQLLQKPCDPDLMDETGQTALHQAAMRGSARCAQLLLEAGADKDRTSHSDFLGATPLWIAVYWDRTEVVQLLLESRANPDGASRAGASPLRIAAEMGRLEMVRRLLESRADTNRTDEEHRASSLWAAACNGHLEVLRTLVAARAAVDAKADEDRVPALGVAAELGHIGTVQVLLDAAADLNATNRAGASPLWIATSRAHVHIMRMLLTTRAETDKANKAGASPLWAASRRGCSEAVRLLLKHGADKDQATRRGTTPYQIAIQSGHLQAALVLFQSGARVATPPAAIAVPLWRGARVRGKFRRKGRRRPAGR